MDDSWLDHTETRENPDKLKMYVMYDKHDSYITFGLNAVAAAENIEREFGPVVDDLSVCHGILVGEQTVRLVDTSLGGIFLKRKRD